MNSADLRARLRLLRARAIVHWGFLRLASALLRGRVREVWVGDSHTVLFNTGRFPHPVISPATSDVWVWHLGPRVMYSVAQNGLPPLLRRMARVLRRLGAGRRATWLVSFGEIDIRCHLVPRVQAGADYAFIDVYFGHLRDLAEDLGVDRIVSVVPPPPAFDSLDHEAFPVDGTPEQRLAVHAEFRRTMVKAAEASGGRVVLLDMTDALSDEEGLLLTELTDDGCHTNDAGRVVTRRAARAFVDSL